jgi:hypothetical protein
LNFQLSKTNKKLWSIKNRFRKININLWEIHFFKKEGVSKEIIYFIKRFPMLDKEQKELKQVTSKIAELQRVKI